MGRTDFLSIALERRLSVAGGVAALIAVLAVSFVFALSGAAEAAAETLSAGEISIQQKTEASAAKQPPVAEGVYVISAASASGQVVDISGGSRDNGANALVWRRGTAKPWQKWQLVWKGGYYEIVNLNSGKLLDVSGASKKSGANVLQWKRTGGLNQRWTVTPSKDGKYVTIKSVLSGMNLDMAGGSFRNGTNVGVWRPNSSNAQKFVLKPASILDQGTYMLGSGLGGGQTADIPDSSRAKGIQVTTWASHGGLNQKFYARAEGKGTYSFQSVASGLFLADQGGKVVQQAWRGSKQQLWTVRFSGGYYLTNVGTGKTLSVDGGKAANASKLVTSSARSGAAQRWWLTSKPLVSDGYYMVRSALGTYLDVTGAAYKDNANMETWTKNNSGAQCFKIVTVGDAFRFENARSFKAVDVSGCSKVDGGNVIQWAVNGGKNQLWNASIDRDGWISFANVNSGKALTVAHGSAKAGANIVQWQASGAKNQQWRLFSVERYSLSGNETLDRNIASVLSTHGSLRSAYDYVAKCFSYREGNRHWGGSHFLPDSTTISYANEMYSRGSGNCYRFASLFSWLARGLGYKTNVVNGWVPSYSGGRAPHGWVEVYSGGTHVCDPDMYNDLRGYDWFMRTYANAPVSYGSW